MEGLSELFPPKTASLINAIEAMRSPQISAMRETPEGFSVKNVATGRSCTITWLGHEPTFQVDFNPGMTGVTFTVATDDACRTAPRATREFLSVDEAARWILQSLGEMSTH